MRIVAIDGPAGSGKSTIAALVAQRLGLDMLDTGAMYRSIACAVLRSGGDPGDAEAASAIADAASISVTKELVTIDGVDVTTEIRGAEVSAAVSQVAVHSGVRSRLRTLQRDWMRLHGGGVVEGRDIGTVVFPDAPVKIFLTASPEVRARRRAGDGHLDVAAAARNIAERDEMDSTREDSPLVAAQDATVIDTSDLDIDEVVARIVEVASVLETEEAP